MEKVNLPIGLIRYASENGIKNKQKLTLTNRMKAYSVVLLVLLGIEVFLLSTRSDYDATILRAKGMLYQEQPDNKISNLYTIKLVNKTRNNLPVEIKVENYPAEIQIVGKDLMVKQEGVSEGEFFVIIDKKDVTMRKSKLEIGVYSNNKKIKTVKTNFLSNVSRLK
jgi:polyferredoxin